MKRVMVTMITAIFNNISLFDDTNETQEYRYSMNGDNRTEFGFISTYAMSAYHH